MYAGNFVIIKNVSIFVRKIIYTNFSNYFNVESTLLVNNEIPCVDFLKSLSFIGYIISLIQSRNFSRLYLL